MKTIQPGDIAKTAAGVDPGDVGGSFSAASRHLYTSEETGSNAQRQAEFAGHLAPVNEADVIAQIERVKERLKAVGEGTPAE